MCFENLFTSLQKFSEYTLIIYCSYPPYILSVSLIFCFTIHAHLKLSLQNILAFLPLTDDNNNDDKRGDENDDHDESDSNEVLDEVTESKPHFLTFS